MRKVRTYRNFHNPKLETKYERKLHGEGYLLGWGTGGENTFGESGECWPVAIVEMPDGKVDYFPVEDIEFITPHVPDVLPSKPPKQILNPTLGRIYKCEKCGGDWYVDSNKNRRVSHSNDRPCQC